MSIIPLLIEECLCGCEGPLSAGLLWAVNKAETEAAGRRLVITVIPRRRLQLGFCLG